jgi:hypothetical protein
MICHFLSGQIWGMPALWHEESEAFLRHFILESNIDSPLHHFTPKISPEFLDAPTEEFSWCSWGLGGLFSRVLPGSMLDDVGWCWMFRKLLWIQHHPTSSMFESQFFFSGLLEPFARCWVATSGHLAEFLAPRGWMERCFTLSRLGV